MIKKLCIITDGYSSEYRIVNSFVENLVNQFQDFGLECVVIAPQSISKNIKAGIKFNKYKYYRKTIKGNIVTILSPMFFSFSAKKKGFINTAQFTLKSYELCVMSTFRKAWKQYNGFDAVYGHFIYPAGILASLIGKKFGIPSFFAYGENGTYSIDYLGTEKTRRLLAYISGVVAVSSLNKKILIRNNICDANKIEVFPNCVNLDLFHSKNKVTLRRELGISDESFVICFTGRFLDVKGILRLDQALCELDDKDIYVFYIGEGPQRPKYNRTLYCGKLEHNILPNYMSASDIFVLPTLAEGCCNAIVEALACGLPVVSSNGEFNDDILDETCSIRIDSLSIEEIKCAIYCLKNDKSLLNKYSQNALKKATNFNIENRARNILDFMEKTQNEFKKNEK